MDIRLSDLLVTNKSKFLTIGILGVFVGFLGGAQLVDLAHKRYTNKEDVLKYPKTNITVATEFSSNGKQIFKTVNVPARIVPDSLLINIQPK